MSNIKRSGLLALFAISLLNGQIAASEDFATKVPDVAIEYGSLYDDVCSSKYGYAVDPKWKQELAQRLPAWKKLWDEEGTLFLKTAMQIAGKPFRQRSFTATLSLCSFPSISMPLIINARYVLSSFTKMPFSDAVLVSIIEHEILHNYLDSFLSRTTPLLVKYKSESQGVRDHLHLFALQKAAYLKLGWKELLKDVIIKDEGLPNSDYKRAWQIVNEKEDYSSFIEELMAAKAPAQEPQVIEIGEKYSLHSKVLDESRPYWVYVPKSYTDTSIAPKKYPVLYLLDGDTHFHSATGVVQFMSEPGQNNNYQIPEAIVVAIPNRNQSERWRDYTSVRDPDDKDTGGAQNFLRFLKDELVPHIESNFRTINYRFLVGHSLGGLLAMDALLSMSSVFQAYVAIDPSLCRDNKFILSKLQKSTIVQKKSNVHGAVYISLPYSEHICKQTTRDFADLLKKSNSEQFRSELQDFKSEDHGSVPLISLYFGLKFIFDGYKPPLDAFVDNPSLINGHYKKISKRLGIELLPPEDLVHKICSQKNTVDKRIECTKINVANYPRSSNRYNALADAYLAKNEKQLAIENFQKSLDLNPRNNKALDSLKRLKEPDEVQWRVGGKIHFEEESGPDYVGLNEINKLVREVLKNALNIRNDDCSDNAKIRLTRKDNEVKMSNYEERNRPGVGEEMHATLLYTQPRGFCNSETLKQVCTNLFRNCDSAPTIESVAAEYGEIIKPDWKFKISEVALTKGAAGDSFVMAKLLFDGHENIYKDGKAISAGLHMTLVNSEDSILGDNKINEMLIKRLNNALKNKMVKIATRNGVVDLEFGISGSSLRIRAIEQVK